MNLGDDNLIYYPSLLETCTPRSTESVWKIYNTSLPKQPNGALQTNMHLLFYTCINISEIKMDTFINDKSFWCSRQLASLRTTISTSQSSGVFFPYDVCSFDPQVASLMMEFHQVWHSIGGLKCHRYWSSTRKGVISGMPPKQNPSVSLRHWCPKNPCPTVQQVGDHQTITYQYT